MSRRKNYYYVITRLRNSCFITFLKNTEAATGGVETVIAGVLQKKGILKNFAYFNAKVRSNAQGTENKKLPLLRNVKFFIKVLAKLSH